MRWRSGRAIIILSLVLLLLAAAGVALGAEEGPGSLADPAVTQSYVQEATARRLDDLEAQLRAAREKVQQLQQAVASLEKMIE